MAFLHSTGGSNPPKYSDKDHDDDAVQQEEEEPLLHQVASRGKSKSRQRFFMKFGLKHWLAINLLLTSLNLAGLITLNILWRTGQQQPAATASQAASCSCPETTDHQHETLLPPSPAISAIEKELRPFTLTSQYSKHPGPEADQAWHDLVNTGAMFPISKEEFMKVNDNPETGIKFTHDPEGRYVATLASTHQVHCVDSLRKGLYFHYKHYKAINDSLFIDKDPPEEHLMHCVEMLRNAVMCFGDVSLITYNWKPGHEAPKGSFKSMHSCQKWERIEDWRRQHNITSQIKTLERPVGLLTALPDKSEKEDDGYA